MDRTKYVINRKFGGFGLTQEVYQWLIDNKGWKLTHKTGNLYHSDILKLIQDGYKLYKMDIGHSMFSGNVYPLCGDGELEFRSNPDLIEAIETIGLEKSADSYARLEIITAPSDHSTLELNDYDGMETLQTIPERF